MECYYIQCVDNVVLSDYVYYCRWHYHTGSVMCKKSILMPKQFEFATQVKSGSHNIVNELIVEFHYITYIIIYAEPDHIP